MTFIQILEQVRRGEISPEEALPLLKGYEDIGFARIDHQRELRIGIPEIVLGENKTVSQISSILRRMTKKGRLVLASRIDETKGAALLREFPTTGTYHSQARIFSIGSQGGSRKDEGLRGEIAILAAGTSDIPVAEEAAVTASLLGSEIRRYYDIGIAGLHRLLDELPKIRNASVLIVIAGMEGALPSVVAGLVGRPIIAVPTSVGYGTGLGGIAAVVAMLNSCAPGVTVVNIDNGVGAAVAACLINRVEILLSPRYPPSGPSRSGPQAPPGLAE